MAEELTTETPKQTQRAVPSNGVGDAEKLVPSFRLEQESVRAREAEALRDSALKEREGMRTEFEKLQAAYNKGQSNYSADMHLLERGFKHESVRRFFRSQYAEAMRELPEGKRVDFEAWLAANEEDPLYAVHFQNRQTGPADEKPQSASAPDAGDDNLLKALRAVLKGNPDSGTGQPAENNEQEWTAEAIRKIRAKNGGTLGDQKDAILAQWRAKKIIK